MLPHAPEKGQKLLVIDGDLVAFRAASVAHRETVWPSESGNPDEDRVTMELDTAAASNYFRCTVDRLKKPGEDVVVALSSHVNFRKQMFPEYKANRAGKAPPLGLGWVRSWVRARFPFAEVQGLEADDLLGLYATGPNNSGVVVCSDDKDIRSIPCVIRSITEPVTEDIIPPAVADWNHMYQTLIGDASDGYSGCPGVGPVAARKILGEPGERPLSDLWDSVVTAYKKKMLSEDDALRQARMARILRWGEFEKTGPAPCEFKINLWSLASGS